MTRRDLVVEALRTPGCMASLSPLEWELLLSQARHAGLLGRLAFICDARLLRTQVPLGPRAQLDAARILTLAQQREVLRELGHLEHALSPLNVDAVLLKGAAYLLSEGPAALGRSFSDVDILVPIDRLPEVEAHLMMAGWVMTHRDAYEQHYYRAWMHELPPMEHAQRGSVLDVHHAILPRTARVCPDVGHLLARAVHVTPSWRVLAPSDMVLHCITHLLHNDDLSHAQRDLSDLDLMLRQFGQREEFWRELLDRAALLQLSRQLHYGLQQVRAMFETPVPTPLLEAAANAGPGALVGAVMARILRTSLSSSHPSLDSGAARAARLAMLVRAHWLRMPPFLLLRHLLTKGWRRFLTSARPKPA
jgi:hypothetical protein